MQKLKILIVDDHRMVRDGIRSMLESQNKKYDFKISEAETGEDGVEQAKRQKFDIIIMDYQLPGISGAEATRQIMKNNRDARVLALSNYNEYMYIEDMIKAGVKGFVLKNIGPDEIIKAIETLMSGKEYYANEVAVKLVKFTHRHSPEKKVYNRKKLQELLTGREIEVMKLVAAEHSNEEIAKKLFISRRTVETHRRNLTNKLNVKGAAGLVKYLELLN